MLLWKAFPREFVFQRIMVPGGAFREKREFECEGTKFRYFFIINACPQRNTELIIVTATTQIQKRYRYRAANPDVLVHINPTVYSVLERPSVIDCDSAFRRTVEDLRSAIGKHEVQPLPPLPSGILECICDAVRAARTLEPRIKRLVLPQDE